LGTDPRRSAARGDGQQAGARDAGAGDAGGRDDAPRALETHPQFHIKLLLDRMGVRREDVALWPAPPLVHWTGEGDAPLANVDGPASRVPFCRALLAPAQFTDDWPNMPRDQRRLPGVTAYDLPDSAYEAQVIALAMREALEVPGRTVALVTPDRGIATRVAGHLERWGIRADDSAGQPLATMAAGSMMLALADAAAQGWAPVAFMALLHHPLVAAGDDRREWVDHARALDLLVRGPRPGAGLAALRTLIAGRRDARRARGDDALLAWFDDLAVRLAPIEQIFNQPRAPGMGAILAALRETMGALAGDAAWAGAGGRALAQFVEDAEAHAPAMTGAMRAAEILPVLRELMRDISVRPPQGGHPRLFIWGLIEARLQRADLMILAGLNEGQWPQPASPDPWLAPVVRRRLGLPGMDRQIGLSGHDFANALGAPQVILTRAQRNGSTPTVASRLRLRIDALMGDVRALEPAGTNHAALAATLDSCAMPCPVARPEPRPDAARRPNRISVTEVDTLLVDPFAFYARAGLGLLRLNPLDAPLTPAWRGTAVHAILHEWLRSQPRTADGIEALAHAMLAQPGVNAITRVLWAPRLIAPLRWAAQQMVDHQIAGRVALVGASEKRGSVDMGGVTLVGTPDRIDRMPDGTLVVVDYKTGSGPTKTAVDQLYALQLGLLGHMAQMGAFTDAAEQVDGFEYWRMRRNDKVRAALAFGMAETPFKTRKPVNVTADNFIDCATDRARDAIGRYLLGDAPFVAKAVPKYATYADYDQLMRFEEWTGREDVVDPPAPLASGQGAA
ncbi:MAG: double-strand break repair protein AddB, partial [Sphingopyxis sp.]